MVLKIIFIVSVFVILFGSIVYGLDQQPTPLPGSFKPGVITSIAGTPITEKIALADGSSILCDSSTQGTIVYIDGKFDALCAQKPTLIDGYSTFKYQWYVCNADGSVDAHGSAGEDVSPTINIYSQQFLCATYISDNINYESWLQCGGKLKRDGVLVPNDYSFGSYSCSKNVWADSSKFPLVLNSGKLLNFKIQPLSEGGILNTFSFRSSGVTHTIKLNSIGPSDFTLIVDGAKFITVTKSDPKVTLPDFGGSGVNLEMTFTIEKTNTLRGTVRLVQAILLKPHIILSYSSSITGNELKAVENGNNILLNQAELVGSKYDLSVSSLTGTVLSYSWEKDGKVIASGFTADKITTTTPGQYKVTLSDLSGKEFPVSFTISFKPVLEGDLDKNGVVNAADIAWIKQHPKEFWEIILKKDISNLNAFVKKMQEKWS